LRYNEPALAHSPRATPSARCNLWKIVVFVGITLALVAVSVFATAILEERENLRRSGPEYASYLLRTRRFIPFVV
jgi:protein-S-isoprenylcysteine O-methyltransferase Ste14